MNGDSIKPAYGYRFEYQGRSAVLSSDTRYNQNVIKYGQGADLLVHEVAMARPELMSEPYVQRIVAHHTTPREAGMVFDKTKPKLAVYTHLVFLANEEIPAPTTSGLIEETRLTYDGPLQVGEDLMSFDIGELIRTRPFEAEAPIRKP